MSQLEKPVPPSGEEIHLPGGSLHPVLLTVGITMLVTGLTISPVLLVGGGAVTLAVIWLWIREAREEMASLPASHGDH